MNANDFKIHNLSYNHLLWLIASTYNLKSENALRCLFYGIVETYYILTNKRQ